MQVTTPMRAMSRTTKWDQTMPFRPGPCPAARLVFLCLFHSSISQHPWLMMVLVRAWMVIGWSHGGWKISTTKDLVFGDGSGGRHME